MCARSPCPRLPAPRRFCLCSGARRMRVRAERGLRGNARADGASPFSPQVRTREHTISRRTTTVASTQTSGVGGDYRGGHTRVDRHHAPRGCCPMFPKSPRTVRRRSTSSPRLDVLSFLTHASSPFPPTRSSRTSCARVRVRRGSGERVARRERLRRVRRAARERGAPRLERIRLPSPLDRRSPRLGRRRLVAQIGARVAP